MSEQRRRYLPARRRGLSQTMARKEAGISRASAWRYDKVLDQEKAARAAVRERYARHAQADDHEDALREAADRDVSLEGPAAFPEPPLDWGTKAPVEEPLVEDESFPAGLLERRLRAQKAPTLPLRHQMFNRRAVVMGHGEMPLSEDMGGRLSRPARWSEEPMPFLGESCNGSRRMERDQASAYRGGQATERLAGGRS